MSGDWAGTLTEMRSDVGFVEGPRNSNPWGPEQGVRNASYCCSFACMVAWHHGYRHWSESQYGDKGDAYVPYHVAHAQAHGEWAYDHSSRGAPCDLQPGDKPVFQWPGGAALGDHIETCIATYADGTFDTIGANTGHPEGVHIVRRDRKYLLGRIRPSGYGAAPAPVPNPAPRPLPFYDKDDDVYPIQANTGKLDGNGNGYLDEFALPASAPVVSIDFNVGDPNNPNEGYRPPPKWGTRDEAGHTRIVFYGGAPGLTFGCTIYVLGKAA